MSQTTLTVVIIHRDEIERTNLRSALEALPNIQIAGERGDLRSGIALAHQVRPNIVVTSMAPPFDDVLSAVAQFKSEHPDTAIFLATESLDPEVLLRALRAGAQEVLRRPLDRGTLREAVERVARATAKKSSGGASQTRGVITVFSNKGGAGVTTIAANVAVGLRMLTQREVVLADFDIHSGDAAFLLGVSPGRSMGDLVAAPRIDSALVQEALTRHESGVFVLPQPEPLDRVEGVTHEQLGSVLEILSSLHDYVVVDAPHVFNDLTLEIFDRSSTILMVCEPSIPSVRAARRSLDIFNKLNFLVSPDRVRLVLNRSSDTGAISVPQLEETLGMKVFGTVANDYATVSNSINVGKPLVGSHEEGRAGRDIATLVRRMVPSESINGATDVVPAKRPGRLRLFGRG
jgi:pilus assembly protein CpaE